MKQNEKFTWFERDVPGIGLLRLQAYRYGKGSIRKVLLMGMHGDELTPYYLVSRLLEQDEPKDYTLEIIPIINVGGLLAGKRLDLIYETNYNRVFFEKRSKSIVEDISSTLLEYVKDSDFILDMHNWESPTVIFGMCFDPICFSDDAFLQIYSSLGAECVVNASRTRDYKKSFGAALLRRPYFPIEYPPQQMLNKEQVVDYSIKLDRTLRGELSREIPVLLDSQIVLNTPCPGIFDPQIEPGNFIEKNDSIGSIIDPLNGFIIHKIYSDTSGYVIYFQNKKFVLDNEAVCVLGNVKK